MRKAWVMALMGLAVMAGSVSGLEIQSESKSLTIARVPAGSEIWLFGVGKSREGYNLLLTTYSEVLTDEDGDGRITFAPSGGLPALASWGAADLASGAVTVLPAPGWAGEIASLPATAIDPTVDSLTLPHRQVEAFLIRPGSAGWRQTFGDGSALDGDGLEDGRVSLSLASLAARDGGSESPGSLTADDTLIVIDTSTLAVVWTGEEVTP